MPTLEELEANYEAVSSYASERIAEYTSEKAMFGDAWPGAAIEIKGLEEAEEKALADLRAHPDYEPVVLPVDKIYPTNPEDIPF